MVRSVAAGQVFLGSGAETSVGMVGWTVSSARVGTDGTVGNAASEVVLSLPSSIGGCGCAIDGSSFPTMCVVRIGSNLQMARAHLIQDFFCTFSDPLFVGWIVCSGTLPAALNGDWPLHQDSLVVIHASHEFPTHLNALSSCWLYITGSKLVA
jgi:hypothetical protein